ncbi:MAG: hypothetical protein Kow0088_12670 [Anaerolineales bacterium]
MQQMRTSSLYTTILPFVLSIGVVLCATFFFYPLRELVGIEIIALLYLFPIGINATFWGLKAGLLSAILAFFVLNFNFIPPYYTLYVHRTQDVVILVVFLVVTIFISQLMGQLRRSLHTAQAREREASSLYDYTREISGLQDEQQILETLKRYIQHTLKAERVSFVVQQHPTAEGISPSGSHSYEEADKNDEINHFIENRPTFTTTINAKDHLTGELRIWRRSAPLSQAETRLVQILASQACAALERVRFVQAQTQAKILAESDRLKASLLSSVSHELRTPLATIKAAISSLRSGSVEWDSEARQELLTMIEEETDHLNLLVSNLLNMSRLESGALTLERAWSNLGEIIRRAVERISPYTKDKTIHIFLSPDIPYLFVDSLLIEQVLINLLNNSLKYAPLHSEIEVEGVFNQAQEVRLEVRNQGPPIPEEYLNRIFDKFFRLEHPQRVGGTGLGLSICKGIIEAHGGKIWAENRQKGIAFVITLPVEKDESEAAAVLLKESKP